MTSTEPRRTRQRAVIWGYIGVSPEFQTAQQIYDRLRALGTPVSLPTVYRTVASMAESGDLDVLTTDGQTAYRRCSPEHHHHLVCRSCGRTIEVTETPIEQWALAIGRQYGFTDISHVIEVTGLCPDCQKNP